MAALKAHEVDRAIRNPDRRYRVILLYGPDSGLVSERADLLARATGVDGNDPFSTIRLDADEAAADRSRLAGEALTIGMFGGERLIRVSGVTRRNLADAVRPVLERELADCWIIIEAGDLDRRSALRTLFEKSPLGLALPCYQDNDEALAMLVREEIVGRGLRIDRDTIAYLKPFLGADRLASRNELAKLSLYAMDDGVVTQDHVRAIVGDASRFGSEDVIDAVSTGNIRQMEENLSRVLEEGLSADMLLVFALRHFQLLHRLAGRIERTRDNPASAVRSARPPVHYSRQDALITALGKWDLAALSQAQRELSDAAYRARSTPGLSASIAGSALSALAVRARNGRQR